MVQLGSVRSYHELFMISAQANGSFILKPPYDVQYTLRVWATINVITEKDQLTWRFIAVSKGPQLDELQERDKLFSLSVNVTYRDSPHLETCFVQDNQSLAGRPDRLRFLV